MNEHIKSIVGNIVPIGAGVGGAIVGGSVGYVIGRKTSKSRRKTHKRRNSYKKSYSKKRKHYRKSKRKRYTPYTARKHRDTSHKRIRYTSRGQPYIIQANGRARFISNRSARVSRKRKGGKY